MEKQGVVRPGVTPDLEEDKEKRAEDDSQCVCGKSRKSARDERDEIKRLAEQDACSRLTDDAK